MAFFGAFWSISALKVPLLGHFCSPKGLFWSISTQKWPLLVFSGGHFCLESASFSPFWGNSAPKLPLFVLFGGASALKVPLQTHMYPKVSLCGCSAPEVPHLMLSGEILSQKSLLCILEVPHLVLFGNISAPKWPFLVLFGIISALKMPLFVLLGCFYPQSASFAAFR